MRPPSENDPVSERDIVFNVVWTGDVYWHLRFFVCSLMDQTEARFRFITNACTPSSLGSIHELATAREQVIEVFDASADAMIAHGVALDAVYRTRDDGPLFCFVDTDIKTDGPYLDEFLELLVHHDAVTSGKEVWTDDVVATPARIGLDGRYLYHENGFTYGSPHFAMYRRDALDDTRERWGIGFGSAGPDIRAATRERLVASGHGYRIFDTAKVLNIMLQEDGHTLRHQEHPALLHIGGLAHFLSPPDPGEKGGEVEEPKWARFDGVRARLEVTRFSARTLRCAVERRPLPELPTGLEASLEERLVRVREAIIDLVERHRAHLADGAASARTRPTAR